MEANLLNNTVYIEHMKPEESRLDRERLNF